MKVNPIITLLLANYSGLLQTTLRLVTTNETTLSLVTKRETTLSLGNDSHTCDSDPVLRQF